jgi:hypothetical protein
MTIDAGSAHIDPRPLAVLVTADLFLGSRLQALIERAGYRVKTVPNSERVVGLNDEEAERVVIDLTTPAVNLMTIVGAFPNDLGQRVAAYAPHVRVDLLRAARGLGIKAVFTRSQLDLELANWLRPKS